MVPEPQEPAAASAEGVQVQKTTLYLPLGLHAEAKRTAVEAQMSLNALIVAALERHIAEAPPVPTSPPPANGRSASSESNNRAETSDFHAAMQSLAVRLDRVERALGAEPDSLGGVARLQRRLTVAEVRDLVRVILLERGSPMPHRALLEHLLYERGVVLPGKDVGENLRTILVHPKSQGFRLIRYRGYWVDDQPAPERSGSSR